MLLEKQARHIRGLDHRVDNHEMELRVISGYILEDRALCKTDTGDEVVSVLRESAERRLDRGRVTWLDITQDDRQIILCPQHSGIGCGVERTIIFSADVEYYADFRLLTGGFRCAIRHVTAGRLKS